MFGCSFWCKPDIMKIAYLYKRHITDADGLDADKVFADDESTRRIERAAMIDGGVGKVNVKF